MRRFACRLLAAVSLVVIAVRAETRPRYGGTLTVEIREAIAPADPNGWPVPLVPLVYDRLVETGDRGELRPGLAVSWQHDAENRRWEFRLREGIRFADGSAVTAPDVAANFRDWADATVAASGPQSVVFRLKTPQPDLPAILAGAQFSILRRGSDGVTVGSGPFRIGEWQPGRRARLEANENYWGGRPFVDSIALEMSRPLREQSIDLELGKADVVELSIEEARRAAQRGMRVWYSAPSELLALVFEPGRAAGEDARVRQALALAIDRAAIHSVLLQKLGESTGALLPSWVTGYAFLFPAARDLGRARQIAAALPKPGPRLTLTYDAGDPAARSIAERIALNAREAGLALQAASGAPGDVRLARVPLRSDRPAQALADLAAAFHLGELIDPRATTPEALYRVEKSALDTFRVVPLFQLPEIAGLGSKVRNWQPRRWGNWRLENCWVEAAP